MSFYLFVDDWWIFSMYIYSVKNVVQIHWLYETVIITKTLKIFFELYQWWLLDFFVVDSAAYVQTEFFMTCKSQLTIWHYYFAEENTWQEIVFQYSIAHYQYQDNIVLLTGNIRHIIFLQIFSLRGQPISYFWWQMTNLAV